MQNISLKHTYKSLPKEFYSEQPVYEYPNAKIIKINYSLADELGLDFTKFGDKQTLDFLLGYTSEAPIAQAYSGHQFGHFTMLGDGRAILLGEYTKPNGDVVDIQLKGAGQTVYSRGGDGRATLKSMLREYIVSEAMHHLGIPTSRILAVISTGENIQRENLEQGAIAVRIASSHIRVGTFQYAATQSKEHLQELLDYTLERHSIPYDGDNKALSLLEYVMDKQSSLIVEWERVGFIHGVMNTDNMTISGETMDYGPCAFMDKYDPDTVFSSIDRNGRYAFLNQSSIAGWNIARLAESLLLLISDDENEAIKLAQELLSNYFHIYTEKWKSMMVSKLSMKSYDDNIVHDFLGIMKVFKLDYTNTFRDFNDSKFEGLSDESFDSWIRAWYELSSQEVNEKVNPYIIPRNHQVEKALEAATKGDLSLMENLVNAISNPYEFSQETHIFMIPPIEKERVKTTFCGT